MTSHDQTLTASLERCSQETENTPVGFGSTGNDQGYYQPNNYDAHVIQVFTLPYKGSIRFFWGGGYE